MIRHLRAEPLTAPRPRPGLCFDAFDPAFREDAELFDRLRREAPVHRGRIGEEELWVFARRADVECLLARPELEPLPADPLGLGALGRKPRPTRAGDPGPAGRPGPAACAATLLPGVSPPCEAAARRLPLHQPLELIRDYVAPVAGRAVATGLLRTTGCESPGPHDRDDAAALAQAWIGNALRALILHPEAWRAVADHGSLALAAADEALRWDPPLPLLLRRARRTTRLLGARVAAGERVGLLLAAACRDPETCEEVLRFRLDRDEAPLHLTSGEPGRRLEAVARAVTAAALGALARRTRRPVLATHRLERNVGAGLSGLARLPVVLG